MPLLESVTNPSPISPGLKHILVYTQFMGTKTISLADDAYERLRAAKREGESFSDVVRRLTSRATLSDYHGALSEETTTEIERAIRDRRDAHRQR